MPLEEISIRSSSTRILSMSGSFASRACSQLGCANTQLTFGISEYGKPYGLIDGVPAPIKFNVSHGGKYGLIAYAKHGRLGVDVEERNTRTDLDSLSEVVFCPEEQADFALTSGKE